MSPKSDTRGPRRPGTAASPGWQRNCIGVIRLTMSGALPVRQAEVGVNRRATDWTIPILGLLLAVFGATGCDDRGSGLGDNQFGAGFETAAFAVVGAEDAFANIEDATLVEPMTMNDPLTGGDFVRHPRHPRHRGSHLRQVLRDLDISSSQRGDIRELVRAHRDVIRPLFQDLREANQDLLDQANLDRQAILDDLSAGVITEEEARELLRELSEATRQAIRDNPDNEPFLQAICNARQELFAAIRMILDEGQQIVFDDWVAGLEGDCFS